MKHLIHVNHLFYAFYVVFLPCIQFSIAVGSLVGVFMERFLVSPACLLWHLAMVDIFEGILVSGNLLFICLKLPLIVCAPYYILHSHSSCNQSVTFPDGRVFSLVIWSPFKLAVLNRSKRNYFCFCLSVTTEK